MQAQIGEVIGWRNLFWSLTDAMACNPEPWVEGTVLPNMRASTVYRMFMTEAYPAVRSIVEKVIASGLIYLPSHARDFNNPDIDKYLARYVRGSNGIDYKQRIKTMKLLWDAIGSEFGARHELYEMNYAGSHELVRLFPLHQATASGALGRDGSARRQMHGRLRRGRLARRRLQRRQRHLHPRQARGVTPAPAWPETAPARLRLTFRATKSRPDMAAMTTAGPNARVWPRLRPFTAAHRAALNLTW